MSNKKRAVCVQRCFFLKPTEHSRGESVEFLDVFVHRQLFPFFRMKPATNKIKRATNKMKIPTSKMKIATNIMKPATNKMQIAMNKMKTLLYLLCLEQVNFM